MSGAGSGGAGGTGDPHKTEGRGARSGVSRSAPGNACLAQPRREAAIRYVRRWSTTAAERELNGRDNGLAWGWMQCDPGKSAPSPPDRKVTRFTGGGECCSEGLLCAPSPAKSHALCSPSVRVKTEARLCWCVACPMYTARTCPFTLWALVHSRQRCVFLFLHRKQLSSFAPLPFPLPFSKI